ncbi:hypothetical protein [Deinococcus aquaticus]|uniref:hypothetical protein n=1 Tax=Deinococcus aquaticus TaxID=328692 RepID=UPI003611F05D
MMVVLILMVIFAGVAAVVYVNTTNRAASRALQDSGRRGELAAGASPAAALPAQPESGAGLTVPLLLSLPEPARTRAWALLSGVTDALKTGAATRARRSCWRRRGTPTCQIPCAPTRT